MFNTIYRTYTRPIDLNATTKIPVDNRKKKYYNYDKIGHFTKNYKQPKKLPWKLISQKNANIINIEQNVIIIKRILSLIDFKNAFISISLNISDIEPKEELDTDK